MGPGAELIAGLGGEGGTYRVDDVPFGVAYRPGSGGKLPISDYELAAVLRV